MTGIWLFGAEYAIIDSSSPDSSYNARNLGTAPNVKLPNPKQAEFILKYKKLDIVADAVHLIVPWGSLVAIFVLLYLMVGRLAGRMTMAQIGVSFLGEMRLPSVVAYIFGGTCFGYGLRERRLRRKKTSGMSSYMTALEQRIDPRRTSSHLTADGTTRPEDER